MYSGSTVLGRYRYEADGLAKGECGLRIVSGIKEDEDLGKWTCAARLQGRKREGYDFITLKTEGMLTTNQSEVANHSIKQTINQNTEKTKVQGA